MAWTLATRPRGHEPGETRALELARRAAALLPTAQILDTLAEALFVNGQTREALTTIDRALLAVGPIDDMDYYRLQKQKFLAQTPQRPVVQ